MRKSSRSIVITTRSSTAVPVAVRGSPRAGRSRRTRRRARACEYSAPTRHDSSASVDHEEVITGLPLADDTPTRRHEPLLGGSRQPFQRPHGQQRQERHPTEPVEHLARDVRTRVQPPQAREAQQGSHRQDHPGSDQCALHPQAEQQHWADGRPESRCCLDEALLDPEDSSRDLLTPGSLEQVLARNGDHALADAVAEQQPLDDAQIGSQPQQHDGRPRATGAAQGAGRRHERHAPAPAHRLGACARENHDAPWKRRAWRPPREVRARARDARPRPPDSLPIQGQGCGGMGRRSAAAGERQMSSPPPAEPSDGVVILHRAVCCDREHPRLPGRLRAAAAHSNRAWCGDPLQTSRKDLAG